MRSASIIGDCAVFSNSRRSLTYAFCPSLARVLLTLLVYIDLTHRSFNVMLCSKLIASVLNEEASGRQSRVAILAQRRCLENGLRRRPAASSGFGQKQVLDLFSFRGGGSLTLTAVL